MPSQRILADLSFLGKMKSSVSTRSMKHSTNCMTTSRLSVEVAGLGMFTFQGSASTRLGGRVCYDV